MAISEKDRSQLLRMAGNIAGDLAHAQACGPNGYGKENEENVSLAAASLALATLRQVDRLIEESKNDSINNP